MDVIAATQLYYDRYSIHHIYTPFLTDSYFLICWIQDVVMVQSKRYLHTSLYRIYTRCYVFQHSIGNTEWDMNSWILMVMDISYYRWISHAHVV